MLFMVPGSCKRNRPVIKCINVSGKSARQLLTGAFALSKQVFEIYQRGVQDAIVQAMVAAGQAVAELLVEPLSGEVLDVGVEAHHALARAEREAGGETDHQRAQAAAGHAGRDAERVYDHDLLVRGVVDPGDVVVFGGLVRVEYHAGGQLVIDVIDVHLAALDAALGGGAGGVQPLYPLGQRAVAALVLEKLVVAGLYGVYVGGGCLAYHVVSLHCSFDHSTTAGTEKPALCGAAAGHELPDAQRAQRYDGGGSENRDDFLHCC